MSFSLFFFFTYRATSSGSSLWTVSTLLYTFGWPGKWSTTWSLITIVSWFLGQRITWSAYCSKLPSVMPANTSSVSDLRATQSGGISTADGAGSSMFDRGRSPFPSCRNHSAKAASLCRVLKFCVSWIVLTCLQKGNDFNIAPTTAAPVENHHRGRSFFHQTAAVTPYCSAGVCWWHTVLPRGSCWLRQGWWDRGSWASGHEHCAAGRYRCLFRELEPAAWTDCGSCDHPSTDQQQFQCMPLRRLFALGHEELTFACCTQRFFLKADRGKGNFKQNTHTWREERNWEFFTCWSSERMHLHEFVLAVAAHSSGLMDNHDH